jgi:hypothetical protein
MYILRRWQTEDLAAADRRRICAAFNRLAAVYTLYNFGDAVNLPQFEFVRDEDLQLERVDRDVKLFNVGWRPKKTYITREYGIPEEDFDLAGGTGKGAEFASRFNHASPRACCPADKPRLLDKFASLFASKEDKAALKDERLMGEFGETMLSAGQEEINALVEGFADALGTVNNLEDISAALLKQYRSQSSDTLAHLIDEVRYASQGIGGRKHG